MTKQANDNTKSLRYFLSIGLAVATLALVLTYVIGVKAVLQSPYADPSHELFMSIYTPLVLGITGGDHSSMSQMHGGIATDSQTQGSSGSQTQAMEGGVLANNILGSPQGMTAAGFGAAVVIIAIPIAAAAFVISWKRRSFLVAGLLAASGISLMILPLANMSFVVPGPIIGVTAGLAILGLGVAKGIRTARVVIAA